MIVPLPSHQACALTPSLLPVMWTAGGLYGLDCSQGQLVCSQGQHVALHCPLGVLSFTQCPHSGARRSKCGSVMCGDRKAMQDGLVSV